MSGDILLPCPPAIRTAWNAMLRPFGYKRSDIISEERPLLPGGGGYNRGCRKIVAAKSGCLTLSPIPSQTNRMVPYRNFEIKSQKRARVDENLLVVSAPATSYTAPSEADSAQRFHGTCPRLYYISAARQPARQPARRRRDERPFLVLGLLAHPPLVSLTIVCLSHPRSLWPDLRSARPCHIQDTMTSSVPVAMPATALNLEIVISGDKVSTSEDDLEYIWRTPPGSPTRKRLRPSPPPPPPPRSAAASASEQTLPVCQPHARARRRLPSASPPCHVYWAGLPPHLLLSILRWSTFHDRVTLMSVCKQWRSISEFRPVLVSVLSDVLGVFETSKEVQAALTSSALSAGVGAMTLVARVLAARCSSCHASVRHPAPGVFFLFFFLFFSFFFFLIFAGARR